MAAITIRNLSDETHRALKARATAHGRSTEAEVRRILDEAVAAGSGAGFGTRLARVAADVGGFDLDVERNRTVSEPIDFS
ncbi:MAG TPA: antitoxin [Nocardioides sp.]|uniref:FitA-like ribbon-helix-helix domain-containing protein n=1 Tax=Nocardioides sp. TaxID=35761 RepID=UPI002ED7A390